MHVPFCFLASLALVASTSAQVRITEVQYNGDEYIEFTNVSAASVDMTGWSFDDDSRIPTTVSLSAFGVLAPGASAILCESDTATFLANWSLSGVAVIGGNTANLGRNDEINLYDPSLALVDRFAYGDQNFVGSIRTVDVSGSPCHGALGANDAYAWTLAYLGDARGSVMSTAGKIGNPGSYTAINAGMATFGSGCPGAGALVPTLAALGCPTFGGHSLLAVENGAAAAPAVLLFGAARGALPIGNCSLLVTPIVVTIPFALDANGAFALPLAVPRDVNAATLTLQVFVLDNSAVDGFAATNGLEISVQ